MELTSQYITQAQIKAQLQALANLLNNCGLLPSEPESVTRQQLYDNNAIRVQVREALRNLAACL